MKTSASTFDLKGKKEKKPKKANIKQYIILYCVSIPPQTPIDDTLSSMCAFQKKNRDIEIWHELIND